MDVSNRDALFHDVFYFFALLSSVLSPDDALKVYMGKGTEMKQCTHKRY